MPHLFLSAVIGMFATMIATMIAIVFALGVEFSGFNNKSSQTLSAVKLKDFLACLGRAEEGSMAYRSGSRW